MAREEAVRALLAEIVETYGCRVSAPAVVLATWVQVLDGYTDAEVSEAWGVWVRTESRAPYPADLRRLILARRPRPLAATPGRVASTETAMGWLRKTRGLLGRPAGESAPGLSLTPPGATRPSGTSAAAARSVVSARR